MSDSGIPDGTSDERFTQEALAWVDDVYRFACSMTRDEADADDIVQETYLRAYRSWHTFQPGSDCRRWLFTICRNVFLRVRERERRKMDVATDAEFEALAALHTATRARQGGYEDLFARLDLGPAIEQAIAALPVVFRMAVVLVDVEGQSYEEAAAIQGVPIGTIRSRLFRGRRLLQEALLMHACDAGFATAAEVRARSDRSGGTLMSANLHTQTGAKRHSNSHSALDP
ncbi:MAG TPA: sigma-70 family RNA polymerase sigma factor [Gemmatimonadaceae bacterium]|nr:sigma-70 family RNA polymerase sigma factor [Gemmatimonadaceae bacterium]